MQKRFAYLWALAFLVLGLIGYGCSAAEDAGTFGDSGDTSSSASGGGSGGEGGCLLDCSGTGTTTGTSMQGVITISPPNAQFDVVNGAANPASVQFTASLNGVDVTSNVLWTFDRPEIGDMYPGSIFNVTGNVGGVGTLTAQYSNSTGTASVTVNIKKIVDGVGVTPTQETEFETPTGGVDNSFTSLLYPYNETVFPLGVLAPELMWNGGGANDIYRLKITEKYFEYIEYFTAPAPSRHIMAQTDWDAVESSGTGSISDPLDVKVTRMAGTVAYNPVQHSWHVAQGSLKGSVYYWELPDACGSGNGRVLRIKPDSTSVDLFYPGSECYGCHTVSRDGTTLFGSWDTSFPFPMQTLDLTQNPAVFGNLTVGNGIGGTFGAFNDDGSKIIYSNDAASNPSGSQLNIIDAVTGQSLVNAAMGVGCGEAAWSPDGKKLAAICQLSGGGWIFDATGGQLNVADFDAASNTVSNQSIIVPQAGAQGRPAYPSFSPGSEWIAFGRPTSGSRSTGNGDLWLVAPDGSGLKQLFTASNDNKSFNPVFAPLRAGGYFWLVYITRRDYGNRLNGANRQQLWITAIDDPPVAGDPSHPPFYIRGQEDCGKSENAYYALDPCKQIGEDCTSGVDCCNGTCVKDPNTGEYVCGQPPDPGECSQDGNSCQTDADCCNAPTSKCIDGFCQKPPPQ